MLYRERSNCGLGESLRARSIRGAGACVSPPYCCAGIDNVGDGRRDSARPAALVFGAQCTDQLCVGIGEKTKRKRTERDARTSLLAVTADALEQPAPLSRRLDAHT